MKKRKYGRTSLALDIANTLISVIYFFLALVFSYSKISNQTYNIVMLVIIVLGMIFCYYTSLSASFAFSLLFILFYSSYNIFLKFRSVPVDKMVYFWVIVLPVCVIVSGYRGHLITKLQDENAGLKKENEELISIDRETGLKNTRLFFEELQAHMNISKRYGIKVYLLVIEIQYKSEIIRAFGRSKYNEIVKELSSLINGFMRQEDKKFYLRENDLFGVVFLSKPEGGREVKKRVKRTLENYQFKSEGILNDIRFQASVGLAEYDPQSNINPYELLEMAKKDMEYDV